MIAETGIISDQLAEITVTYSNKIPVKQRVQIQDSKEASNALRSIWPEGTIEYKERFYILCMSRSNHILGYFQHSAGGLSGTVVDIKQILATAIVANSAGIVLCHNHPSGNTNPSEIDKSLTKKVVSAAKLLDLKVLDHIILTSTTYFSFSDEGLIHH